MPADKTPEKKPDNKLPLRLPLVIHAYLEDLADFGTFGKGKTGVAKRFIEDGIQAAIDRKVISRRNAKDYPDSQQDED